MRNKKGITLVELILSIVIISICVTSIVKIYQEVSHGSFRVRVMTTSTALAEGQMEETLNLGFAGVANVASTSFASPFSDYSYQVIVHYVEATDLDTSVDPTVTDYRNIEVQVTHNTIGTITVNALLTNY